MTDRTSASTLEKATTFGLFALLATPLLFARSFIFPFVALKVPVFQVLVAALVALWITRLVREKRRPRLSALTISLLVLFAVLILTALTGVDVMRSFWSTQDRMLGLIALAHFLAFAFVLMDLGDGFPWKKYLRVSFCVSVITAIGAAIQPWSWQFFLDQSGVTRPGSFFGNPTFLAAYLLFNIFFGLWFAFEAWTERARAWAALYVGLSAFEVYIIFLTQTRGALLGLAAGAGAWLLAQAFGGSRAPVFAARSPRFLAAACLIVLLLGFGGFWATRHLPFWQNVPGVRRLTGLTLQSADIQARLIALDIAWKSFEARPFLGYGFENFKYPFDTYYEPKLLRSGFSETYFDKPHNILVEYAVVGGVVGLLAYLAMLSVVAWTLARAARLRAFRPFGFAMFTAYIVQNIFVFDTFGGLLAWFLLLGYIGAEAQAERPAPPPPLLTRAERRRGVLASTLGERATFGLCALAVLGWTFVNGAVMVANNAQYWGLNYFVNRLPAQALDSFRTAITMPANIYRDQARRDLVSSYSQMVEQHVEMPDVVSSTAWVMDEFRKAIADQPNDYFLRVTFADSATMVAGIDRSYLPEARDQLAEAMRLSPRRQQNYYTLAKLDILDGRYADALATMRQAIDLDPGVAEPHFYYALIAFSAGHQSDGFKELAEAKSLGREPKTASEMTIVANQEGDAGHYPEAAALYESALALQPDNGEIELKLGLVYYYE
ncbi:MAG TPA: O-antigen ligase family protein, partial [Candidatus Paceibacterota bacterium]|nr:O-antigen ligase family protein [Candidatus Paceibacterota bacterium]